MAVFFFCLLTLHSSLRSTQKHSLVTMLSVIVIALVINTINCQSCDNDTFPLVQNKQAIGLYPPPQPASTFDECEQRCCDESSPLCTVFQWCGNISSETCTPKNSCFIGNSYNFYGDQSGWNGRSKPMPAPLFAFTNVHGNSMVLQRAPYRAQVYGTSPYIGDIVKVTLYDPNNTAIDIITTSVDANYSWLVQLSPIPASMNGEEYRITAQSTQNISATIELTNILFGDVYICSGQSNMQFTVDQAFNLSQSLSEANNYPLLRLISVSETSSSTPLNQVISLKQEWSVANNLSVSGGNWTYFRYTTYINL